MTTGTRPVPIGQANGRAVPVPSGMPKAVWSGQPTLGEVVGQRYLGRIVVEVFGAGGQTAFIPADTRAFAGRAIGALRSRGPFKVTGDPWPAAPIMGPSHSHGAFAGRVVVELWDGATTVAVSKGAANPSELAQSAVRALLNTIAG